MTQSLSLTPGCDISGRTVCQAVSAMLSVSCCQCHAVNAMLSVPCCQCHLVSVIGVMLLDVMAWRVWMSHLENFRQMVKI